MSKFFPKVFSYRAFTLIFIAGVISSFGSFVTAEACNLWLFKLTDSSKSILGLNRGVFILLLSLGSFVGGNLGAGLNKPIRFMALTELIRIPLTLSLLTIKTPYLIVILNGLIGFCSGLFNPIRQMTINLSLPKSQLASANNLQSTALALMLLTGPFLGVQIYQAFNSIVPIIIIDVATYLLAIILLYLVKQNDMPNEVTVLKTSHKEFLKIYREGLNFCKTELKLKAILTHYSILGMAIGILIPLILPYTVTGLGGTPSDFAKILLLFGVGGLFGGKLTEYLGRTHSYGKIAISCGYLEVVMMLAFSFFSNLYVACFVILIWGIIVFIRIPAQFTYISHHVPKEFLSRVHSLLEISFVIPHMLGSFIVAFLGSYFQASTMLRGTGIIFLLIMLWRLKAKGVQNLLKQTGPSE